MKKLLYIILIFSSSCGHKSPEERAKKLIDEQMKLTLNDYKSYEPVTFGKLDSSFTDFKDDPKYIADAKTADSVMKEMNSMSEDMKIYGQLWANSGTLK